MNCKLAKKLIYPWVDGELKEGLQEELKIHIESCLTCRKESESRRSFSELLLDSSISIAPSPDFDANFWAKLAARQKKPVVIRIFEDIGSFIPVPSLAQAAAVLLVAIFIGGGVGFVSAMPSSSISLSGFQEIKGIPKPSISGAYFKMVEAGEVK